MVQPCGQTDNQAMLPGFPAKLPSQASQPDLPARLPSHWTLRRLWFFPAALLTVCLSANASRADFCTLQSPDAFLQTKKLFFCNFQVNLAWWTAIHLWAEGIHQGRPTALQVSTKYFSGAPVPGGQGMSAEWHARKQCGWHNSFKIGWATWPSGQSSGGPRGPKLPRLSTSTLSTMSLIGCRQPSLWT